MSALQYTHTSDIAKEVSVKNRSQ